MRLFVDNLINIDFSYLDPQRGLVGETWMAHVELFGELDEQSMICDFGIVKKTLREWLDEQLDHRLLIPTAATQLSLTHSGHQTTIEWQFNEQSLSCQSPVSSFALVTTDEITPNNVAKWCINQLQSIFPDSIEQIALYFSTEQIDGRWYHYSHGLKKHAGNCQRIAHGHRSGIKIWRNGELCNESMSKWSNRLSDIYIGTRDDLAEETDDHYQFAYEARQGQFHLRLPKSCCYLMDTDTTIEQIARHIASELYRENPGDEFVVKAFEGIGKGAIADS